MFWCYPLFITRSFHFYSSLSCKCVLWMLYVFWRICFYFRIQQIKKIVNFLACWVNLYNIRKVYIRLTWQITVCVSHQFSKHLFFKVPLTFVLQFGSIYLCLYNDDMIECYWYLLDWEFKTNIKDVIIVFNNIYEITCMSCSIYHIHL